MMTSPRRVEINVEKDMAKDKLKEASIFDISRLKELIELMQEHELNEVDLKQAEQRIRLRRGCLLYTSPSPRD